MSLMTSHDRQLRILQLAQEWDIALPPLLGPLTRPESPPSFQTPDDDNSADMLIQYRVLDMAQAKPKSPLSRAFSSSGLKRGKHWEPRDIVDTLAGVIATGGSAGVAEALLNKLAAAGVELQVAAKQKSGLLNRKKSVDSFVDRTALLRMAVDGNQLEMTELLLPLADPAALDTCLPLAIRLGNPRLVEQLLRYGASIGEHGEGTDVFRQACVHDALAPIVGLVLRSDGRPPTQLVSEAMVDAARAGSVENVVQLSKATADGDYNQAEALRCAVAIGRRDIVLAIVMGLRPPQPSSINDAFLMLAEHPTLDKSSKLEISEILLCAGANGSIVAHVLEQSCSNDFIDMARLLATHGASIEFNNGAALKQAISSNRMDYVMAIFNESSSLNSTLASECTSLIPKQVTFEIRNELLTLLLKKGASGRPLDQCLIDAAETGDLTAVDLLLQPYFALPPGQQAINRQSLRHQVASPNYRSGEALRTAVLRADILLAEKILAARPTSDTLTAVFPLTRNLYQSDRSQMIELFLRGSLSGECLHVALQDSLDSPASQRDDDLIKLLLDHGADINYNSGEALVPIIKQMDLKFLNGIIAKVSPQTAAIQIQHAVKVPDHKARFEILTMLLRMGAAIGIKEINGAIIDTILEKPVDLAILQLLLDKGNADINNMDGAIVKKAMENNDPQVLETVLTYGKPNEITISRALQDLAGMFSNETKKRKISALLAKSSRIDDLNRILLHEAQSLIQHRDKSPSMATFEHLLEAGADPNSYKAATLCHAVIGTNDAILDLIFKCRYPPTVVSLGFALPHALRVTNADARLNLTTRLVESGADALEVNRALTYAIGAYPQSTMLLAILAKSADMSDGEALPMAVTKQLPELVDVILHSFKHTQDVRHVAMGQAIEIKNRSIRTIICELLLEVGVSTDIASGALLVAARDGDLALGKLLMAHGASISGNSGQAIIEGSRGGSVEVLDVLLKSGAEPTKLTLEKAFQAATEVRDLSKRAVIFELLLSKGVSGQIVDSQLESAARYGESGQALLKVLLASGADPNYNDGEAVLAATRSANVICLELLLGIWSDNLNQIPVSNPVLSSALNASLQLNRSIRFRIVQSLITAGLPADETVHKVLNHVVKEEDPEERLVKLLIDHGASPTANDCQSLIDASNNVAAKCLPLLFTREMSKVDINRAYSSSFTAERYKKWFTDDGLRTAKLLLDKGAKGTKGEALSSSLVLVLKNSTEATNNLSDRFVSLLVSYGPDVNFNHGEPLQVAASKANVGWAKALLTCKPNSETLSLAFQCIFDTALSEEDVLQLFKLFADYRQDGSEIDVMTKQQGEQPILVRAMSQYPRSTTVVSTLLDAGYYHDQRVKCKLHEHADEEEDVTLLAWAIAQPQKKVSTAVIETLTERGANVNTPSSITSTTPLMLAIQCRRPDVVNTLLLEGADVDVVDQHGRTPLAMTTLMGGDVAVKMMSSILAADPSSDDGSLHNSAQQLNMAAVKVLIKAGHHPDFPSAIHNGRSALSEVCLHGTNNDLAPAELERQMQKIMSFLLESNSDPAIKYNGKSALLLCFDATNPIVATRALLKSGFWKHIDKSFNYYTDESHTYSPTMYLKKLVKPSDTSEDLIGILRANRATDVFYANNGAQPEDAAGLPEDIAVLERARLARLARLAEESQEHATLLARRREAASVEQQISDQRAQLEETRRRRQQSEELQAMKTKANLEEDIAAATMQRRMAEQHMLTEAHMNRARALATAEQQAQEIKQRKALEWEGLMNKERIDNTRQMSAIRISEREAVDRIDSVAEQRLGKRLDSQRKLVESQERLASRIAAGTGTSNADARRQIGFVTELN